MLCAMALRALSLCAGVGGIDLGLAAAIPGFRTVCYVEREAFCAAILAARMADGALDDAPIWDDLSTFDATAWRGAVDLVTAGYPCQPFSEAGRRKGKEDPRHLWPHVARIIAECRPAYAFLENVPGHVSLGLRDVCADLRQMGYHVSAGIFSAAECGAPHLRKRLFILAADANGKRLRQRAGVSRQAQADPYAYGPVQFVADAERMREPQSQGCERQKRGRAGDGCSHVAHADDAERRPDSTPGRDVDDRLYGLPQGRQQGDGQPGVSGQVYGAAKRGQARCGAAKQRMGDSTHGLPGWLDGWEHDIARTCDGAPHRIDQLRALSNAVVPATAALAWRMLYG